jgi:Helix-turn-helix domain
MTMNERVSTDTILGQAQSKYLATPAEVANLLRVPVTWVYAHQRELPGLLRLGRYVRFRRVAIEQLLLQK